MDELHFSTASLIAASVEGILAVLLPIVIIVVWKIKSKARLVPFWTGCLFFPLFALIIESTVAAIISFIDAMTLSLFSNTYILYLFAALMAGLFEETGRFVAFKTMMKKYNDRRDGVTYGIGHGGIESILLVGGSVCFTLAIALIVNAGAIDTFMESAPAESREALTEQLRTMAETSPSMYLLGFVERISAVMVHISLSILVFAGVKMKGKKWNYPLAIFLHFAIDCTVILPNCLNVPMLLFEIIFFIVSLAMLISMIVYYKKLPQVLGDEELVIPTVTA